MSCTKHKSNIYYRCKGCDRPMCEVGERHKSNIYYRCQGCDRPMCEVEGKEKANKKINNDKNNEKKK